MRRLARVLLAVAVSGWAFFAFAPSAWAIETVVAPNVESWYHVAPQPPPAPVPFSPYPAETLHVGISVGNENARTYLKLDLGAVTSTDQINGGTLTLPVDPGDGTFQAETAQIKACFAPEPGREVRGSFGPLPAVNCTISSKGQYVPTPTPRFLIDLTPFTTTQGPGPAIKTGGVALMPADEAIAARASWHVAMYARANTTAGAPKISATIFHQPPIQDPGFDESFEIEAAPTFEESPPLAFVNPEPPAVPAAAPLAPPQNPAGLITPIGEEESRAYLGWVFLLPLMLPLFVRYFGRALTLDDDLEEDLPRLASRR